MATLSVSSASVYGLMTTPSKIANVTKLAVKDNSYDTLVTPSRIVTVTKLAVKDNSYDLMVTPSRIATFNANRLVTLDGIQPLTYNMVKYVRPFQAPVKKNGNWL